MGPERVFVGGLEVFVFGLPAVKRANNRSPSCIFITHGRNGAAHDVFHVCQSLVDSGEQGQRIAVSVEQRNHGKRVAEPQRNLGWEINKTYALDMFAIQYGTACDIRYLIDALPLYLELTPCYFGVAGVSIGGYACLLAMSQDKRLRIGASLLGYADFKTLIEYKAVSNNMCIHGPEFKSRMNEQLLNFLAEHDLIHLVGEFPDRPLLLILGGDDRVVPPACNEAFSNKLRALYSDSQAFSISVHEKVGHELTPSMLKQTVDWFLRWENMWLRGGDTSSSQAHDIQLNPLLETIKLPPAIASARFKPT